MLVISELDGKAFPKTALRMRWSFAKAKQLKNWDTMSVVTLDDDGYGICFMLLVIFSIYKVNKSLICKMLFFRFKLRD